MKNRNVPEIRKWKKCKNRNVPEIGELFLNYKRKKMNYVEYILKVV